MCESNSVIYIDTEVMYHDIKIIKQLYFCLFFQQIALHMKFYILNFNWRNLGQDIFHANPQFENFGTS